MKPQELQNIKKGDILVYNNPKGETSEWVVDYPNQLLNPHHTVTLGLTPEVRVGESVKSGGGDIPPNVIGGIRVSRILANGRGPQRQSFLITDFSNWSVKQVHTGGFEGPTPVKMRTPVTPIVEPIILIDLDPTVNSTDVQTSDLIITLTFSRNFKIGSGAARLIPTSGDTLIYNINGDFVKRLENKLFIKPGVLQANTEYVVTLDTNCILDPMDNMPVDVFGGNKYSFTTIAAEVNEEVHPEPETPPDENESENPDDNSDFENASEADA